MKQPGKPAIHRAGNSLYFTIKNLCICFQEFKEFPRTYVAVTRLWLDPLLAVELPENNDTEKVVKHHKVSSRGYLATKLPVQPSEIDCP
jgi:hypothetical protein